MLTAKPPVPLEGAPLWLNAVLILAPIAAGIVTVYLARGGKKTEDKPEDPPNNRQAAPAPPPPTVVIGPGTVDEKFDMTERYVQLLEETKREQDRDIAELTRRVKWLEERDQEKDETIRQLRMLVDRLAPPFPQRPQHWTPPPTV